MRIAIVGVLLLHAALLTHSMEAPSSQRVPEKGPLVANQPSDKAKNSEYPTESSPLPVRMIQSPSDATNAQAREAKADQHNDENLRVQVRAANAAEWQAMVAVAAGVLSLIGTVLLVWTMFETRKTANAARAQAESFMNSERAYLKLSHLPPGFKADGGTYQVTLEVKNWGKTPAHVTDVCIGFKTTAFGEPLPIPYPYPSGERESFPNAFLVPGEFITVSKHTGTDPSTVAVQQLWVFGHVDYKDAFGHRWRGGYARKFVDRKDNNLVYNTEQRDNFDRKRQPGEGNDWNDE